MKEMIEKGKLIKLKSGSHLYGLNTEKSDVDFVGVFLAPKEYILGLKKADIVASNPPYNFDGLDNMKIVFYETCKQNKESPHLTLKDLKINGNDLLKLGYKGKDIGVQLSILLDFVLENGSHCNDYKTLEKICINKK